MTNILRPTYSGRSRIATGAEAVKARVEYRLRLQRGTDYAAPNHGLPWDEWTTQGGRPPVAEVVAEVQAQIESVSGVVSVSRVDVTFDGETLRIAVDYTAADGDTLRSLIDAP